MKYLLVLSAVIVLAGCSKNSTQDIAATKQNPQPETCNFGNTSFNLVKREAVIELEGRKPIVTSPTPTSTTSSAGVIYLDFDGYFVSGTSWNYSGDFTCSPANLSSSTITNITNRVINDYSPFNIVVTTDQNVYNAAPIAKRMRVVVTESWEWFGQAGGTSFVNSFTWGNNTPCFVFSSLLNYSEKNIGEAVAHEAGHTLGLQHQASYTGTSMTNAYNYGAGIGEIGWAPIMGCGYYQNLTTWHNGPTATGSGSSQNDVGIITSVVGLRSDDYSNSTSGAQALSGSLNGTINSSSDADFFSVNLSTAKTLSVNPFNVGANDAGANLDIIVRIYNAQGQLIGTINDPAVLNAITTLNAGQYYVSVATAANEYASTYGMLGQYTISLN